MLTACSSKSVKNANVVMGSLVKADPSGPLYNYARKNPVIKAADGVVVTATCYQACVAQCNADPFNTAFGYKINPQKPESHRYLALSRDLEVHFAAGDSVWVEGAGVYNGAWLIADRMNRRYKRRIDFLVGMKSHLDLYRNVTITTIDDAWRESNG